MNSLVVRSVVSYAILVLSFGSAQLFAQPAPAAVQAVSTGAKHPPAPERQAIKDWRDKLANNTSAPIKVIEFFDYQCPFCSSAVPALEEALKSHPGDVQLILKHDPLPIHHDSLLAHQAALAAGEQGKFWEMHDLLFAHQHKVKPQDLLEYARQLHLDVRRFQERLESGYYKPAVEQDMALAKALGVDGTPTFFINGQKLTGVQSVARLRGALEGKPPSSKPEKPAATVASLDFSHSPVRGSADAALTIVEFSDAQCPFCARAVPTMQELLKQYPTQIKWVFKNFPLGFHADSELAHRALLAAGEQGKFWEMHDLVFAGQKEIKKDNLLEKARNLNLDMTKFSADLESNIIKQQIEQDKQEGNALRVDGTPTFFINGHEYSGAMSLDRFKSVIEKELALGSPSSAGGPLVKSVAQQDIVFGPANAPLTLVWFSDLQSDLTLKATLVLRELMTAHPGKIRLVFKNRPLESHPDSIMLHEAAMAANAQGKFWQMHDLIISNPQKIARQDLVSYAQRIGLNVPLFQEELDNHKYRSTINRDLDEARKRTVQGAPVFFLNATRIDGLQPAKVFEDLVTAALAQQLHASSR
jgi:protein-disulfide isomerase